MKECMLNIKSIHYTAAFFPSTGEKNSHAFWVLSASSIPNHFHSICRIFLHDHRSCKDRFICIFCKIMKHGLWYFSSTLTFFNHSGCQTFYALNTEHVHLLKTSCMHSQFTKSLALWHKCLDRGPVFRKRNERIGMFYISFYSVPPSHSNKRIGYYSMTAFLLMSKAD